MAGGRQATSELVGRGREIVQLEEALALVATGSRWTVEVVGEPGIGKSRLLQELCGHAETRGFLVLEGRAAEFEQDIPFGVIVDALNDYVGSLEPPLFRALDAEAVQELASIFPSLSMLADTDAIARADASRYRIHYALRALLERLARRQAILLALDDLHWADAASFEVVAHVLRRFNGPLLMALAFRHAPSRLAAALETNSREGFGSRLEPAPLNRAEARALLDPGIDPALGEELYLESGGNPFYLEQLARADRYPSSPVPLTTPDHDEVWTAPPGVIAAIGQELARLPPDRRRLLEAAAVAGESFDPSLLAAIAEVDEQETLVALDELLGVDLLRPTAVPRSFRFRHPIVRRVVYDAAPGGWRIGAHARAAGALASRHTGGTDLAHHLALSASVGDEWAIDQLIAASRSTAPRAPLTAGRWLLSAVRLLPPGSVERRVALLAEAGGLLTSGAAYDEALASLDEALSAARSDQVELRAGLIAQRTEARRRAGHPFTSRSQLELALQSLANRSDETVLSVCVELMMDRYWHGDFANLRILAAEVLKAAVEREDGPITSLAASLSSLAHSREQNLSRAVVYMDQAQAAFTGLTDERLAERLYVTQYIGEGALQLERADDALAQARRGFEVARMTGQGAAARSWVGLEVYALLMKGQAANAARSAEEWISPAALATDDWRIIWLAGADSLAALRAGAVERALASANEMLIRSQRTHADTVLPGFARVHLAGALFATGDPSSARAELSPLDTDTSGWLLDLNCAHGWDTLVRAELALGDLEAAEGAVSRAEGRTPDARLRQQTATVRCASAAVKLAAGDPRAAAAAAEDAAALAESAANPLLEARCRAQAGAALAALGDRDRGVAELESAEAALSACGARREADAAARELRRLGRRVTRAGRREQTAGLLALSSREREVANEVAMGKTNRAVAATLFVSEKTVESHLARIYAKLEVHSRAALATIIARDAGDGSRDRP
jgi:DNA-binding NarL/FixJ family response regulator